MAQAGRRDNRPADEALEHTRRVGTMFSRIARRYDLMNRLMTAGLDRRWRRLTVRAATAHGAVDVLDVGTGTGDVALALAAAPGVRRVLGLDLVPEMVTLAQQKPSRGPAAVSYGVASVTALPLRDSCVGAVTTAFMVRNLPDPVAGLAEMRRVLRPGGRLVCLEITRPRSGIVKRAFDLYFHHVVPRLGRIVSGDREAYSYLPSSVERFLSAEELAATMRAAGLVKVGYRYVGPGGVAIHVGERT